MTLKRIFAAVLLFELIVTILAVVLKILHYPYASILITVGLIGMVAVIALGIIMLANFVFTKAKM
jgi:hypothetical protein